MIQNHDDLLALQAAIYQVCDDLEKHGDAFAAARQVVEYDSDRRKQLLSKCVLSAPGKAMNEREAFARASAEYDAGLVELGKQYAAAEREISLYFRRQGKLDALRSILSVQSKLIGL